MPEPTGKPPNDFLLDETPQERRQRDVACANDIADALNRRFGYVQLSERYGLADAVIAAAREHAEHIARLLRTLENLPEDEQRLAAARTLADALREDPHVLDPDPPEPDWRAGERS